MLSYSTRVLTTAVRRAAREAHIRHHQASAAAATSFNKTDLVKAEISRNSGIVNIHFTNNPPLQYPTIWLRDNCLCPKCYERASNGRIIKLQDFTTDVDIVETKVIDNHLQIEWSDGHRSSFSNNWLTDRSFNREQRLLRIAQETPIKIPWNAQQFHERNVCKTFQFNSVMTDDKILLEWLENLAQYGIVILKNTPKDPNHVEELGKRIAFHRRTLYGSLFHVRHVEQAYNLAYKAAPLQFHTDIPHYRHMPGVNLLHCLVQSKNGGDNTFCDSINAVKQLPPRIYRILADTPVDWSDRGVEDGKKFIASHRAPVICEDREGNLTRVNWNQGIRDSFFNVSVDQAIDWYEAMKVFIDVIHDPANAVEHKIEAGDVLTFDNHRMIHGRKNYTDGDRHIVGAYMDWDEIYSRIRVLRQSLIG